MSSVEQHTTITGDNLKHYRAWVIALSVLLILLGVAAIVFPFLASLAVEQTLGWILGVLSVTLLVAMLFVVGGLLRIGLALQLRRIGRYETTLASGVLSLALGAVMIVLWPAAATWLIGILVGIDVLFAGFASLAFATMVAG